MFARSRIVALGVIAALLLSNRALCQQIPQRLNARDLDRYARVLQLSPEQRNAAYELYEQYVADYDQQIGTFVEPVVTEENRARTFRDQKEYFDAAYGRRIRLRDQIRAIDAQLLAQLDPLLTEDQRLNLPRVRDDRFRRTALVEAFFDNVGGVLRETLVDLSQLIGEIELSPAEVQRVDPVLAAYESRRTALVRAVESHAIRFYWVDGLDEMIARGHGELLLDDNQEFWEQVAAEVCETKGRRAIELARAIDDLNHLTAIRIRDQLDAGNRDIWMERFYEVAFWSSAPINNVMENIRFFRAGLTRLKMPDAQMAVATSIIDEFERRLRLVGDRWVEQAREAFAPNHQEAFIASWYAFRDRGFGGTSEIAALGQWLKNEFESGLGPAGWAALHTAVKEPSEVNEDPVQGFGRPLMLTQGPLQITSGEFERWLDVLDIGGEVRTALLLAHAEYDFVFKPVVQRSEARKSVPPVLKQQLERISELDRRLYDSIREAITDQAAHRLLDAIRHSRRRMLFGMHCSGRAGGAVDPVMLFIHSGLDTQTIAMAIAATADEFAALEPLIQSRWRYGISDYEFGLRHASGEATADEEEALVELYHRNEAISSQIAAKHFDLMRIMCDAIAGDDGEDLWNRFLRIALAPIATDERAVHALLQDALTRNNLTADQRARLEELVLDYQRQYAVLTDQLLERGKFATWWNTDRRTGLLLPRVPVERWSMRNEYLQIKQDRDDLNEFARLQLELILDPHDDDGVLIDR